MKRKILLAGLIMTMVVFATTVPAQAQAGFGKGCVVREWATDPTPSYQINGPSKCVGLDRQLDGDDGPNRGRVRAGFENRGNNKKRESGHWN